MRRALITALAILLGVSGSLGWTAKQYLDTDALPGAMLGGHRYLPALHGSPQAFVALRAEQLARRGVLLSVPDHVYALSYSELGLALDQEAALAALRAHARDGGLLKRARNAIAARQGKLEVPLKVSFDEASARHVLEPLIAIQRREAVDARLDLVNHRRIESVTGRAFDLEGTLKELRGAERAPDQVVPAQFIPVEPAVPSESLVAVDVSSVLASYRTSFKGKAGPRAVNIAKAAEYLNGTVLLPGAEFSFNHVVGRRERERGFVDAPVIVKDEMEPGVGGGVCQVASTLHAAAVFGALEITRRRSHSRPSGYTPLGLDATVIDDEVDLRLRNPYDTPLIIHAFLPSRYVLQVELLGREAPGTIEHFYTVKQRHDFVRRIVPKPFLDAGQVEQKQKGTYGYDVVSTVRIVYPDGTRSVRHYSSKYHPVPEVFWVAEGTDPGALPELPEGATGVEYKDPREDEQGSLLGDDAPLAYNE